MASGLLVLVLSVFVEDYAWCQWVVFFMTFKIVAFLFRLRKEADEEKDD